MCYDDSYVVGGGWQRHDGALLRRRLPTDQNAAGVECVSSRRGVLVAPLRRFVKSPLSLNRGCQGWLCGGKRHIVWISE